MLTKSRVVKSITVCLLVLPLLAAALALQDKARSTVAPKQAPLPTRSPDAVEQKSNDYGAGFRDGLAEHQRMLDQIRKEFESLQKTNTVLTLFYGVLILILFGTGILSVKNVIDASRAAQTAKEEVSQFTAIRKAVLSELNNYLKKFPIKEWTLSGTGATSGISSIEKANIHEADHITFLSNPLFRFREPETPEEVRLYSRVLLTSIRWHLAEGRYADSLLRLETLFSVLGSAQAIADKSLTARAHSYMALAYLGILGEEQKERLIDTDDRKLRIPAYRQQIVNNLEKAKKLDPTWPMSYLWEAYYLSIYPDVTGLSTDSEKKATRKKGQERAIVIYRKLIDESEKFEPDVWHTAQLNLCCCLKRLGDLRSDYSRLFSELKLIKSEADLRSRYGRTSTPENAPALNIWRRMLADDTFFNDVKMDLIEYRDAWKEILRTKLSITDPKSVYLLLEKQGRSPANWQVSVSDG